MKLPRKNHSPTFKARVALEAVQGVKTVAEIAEENGLHPTQVNNWKKELMQGAEELFVRKNAPDLEKKSLEKKSLEKNCERLERKVGQLVIEKEWL